MTRFRFRRNNGFSPNSIVARIYNIWDVKCNDCGLDDIVSGGLPAACKWARSHSYFFHYDIPVDSPEFIVFRVVSRK